MDKKGKEWMKMNWYRPVLHTVPFVIFMIICFFILDFWTVSLDNDTTMEWNIFVTIAIFGGLCWITLILLYLEKWADRFDVYKSEYLAYVNGGEK